MVITPWCGMGMEHKHFFCLKLLWYLIGCFITPVIWGISIIPISNKNKLVLNIPHFIKIYAIFCMIMIGCVSSKVLQNRHFRWFQGMQSMLKRLWPSLNASTYMLRIWRYDTTVLVKNTCSAYQQANSHFSPVNFLIVFPIIQMHVLWVKRLFLIIFV